MQVFAPNSLRSLLVVVALLALGLPSRTAEAQEAATKSSQLAASDQTDAAQPATNPEPAQTSVNEKEKNIRQQPPAKESHTEHKVWSYANQESWAREFPGCIGENRRQSPIDIDTDTVVLRPKWNLELIDYDQFVEFHYKNNHHSVSAVPLPSVAKPSIRLSWLPLDLFELQEIHFHWGDGINKGSEHEINDQKAAAEMHMVHYRKGVTKDDLGNTENSVLVVGVLIESDNAEHAKLEGLVSGASQINGTDSEFTSDNPQSLINMLPDHHQSFYTYNGSLTTPPCYEVVTWIIMSEPVYMADKRLVELANVEANLGRGRQKISANHRDVQPLLGRPVYVSFNVSESVTVKIGDSSADFSAAFEHYWSTMSTFWRNIGRTTARAMRRVDNMRRNLLDRLGVYSLVNNLRSIYFGSDQSNQQQQQW